MSEVVDKLKQMGREIGEWKEIEKRKSESEVGRRRFRRWICGRRELTFGSAKTENRNLNENLWNLVGLG